MIGLRRTLSARAAAPTSTRIAAVIAAGLTLSATLAVTGCTPRADRAAGGSSQQGNDGVGSAGGAPGSVSSGGQNSGTTNPAAVEPELSSVESLLTGVDGDLAGADQAPADAD